MEKYIIPLSLASLLVSHHNSVIRCDISNSTHNYFPSITHTITSTHFSPLLSIHQQSSPHHLTLPPLTDLPVTVASQVVLGLLAFLMLMEQLVHNLEHWSHKRGLLALVKHYSHTSSDNTPSHDTPSHTTSSHDTSSDTTPSDTISFHKRGLLALVKHHTHTPTPFFHTPLSNTHCHRSSSLPTHHILNTHLTHFACFLLF